MKIATRALAGLFAAAVTLSPGAARELPRTQADAEHAGPNQPASKPSTQDRRFKWWQDAGVKAELGLSTRQSEKVDRIWAEVRRGACGSGRLGHRRVATGAAKCILHL